MASSARLCTAKRLCVESARISSRPLAFLPPSRNFSCSTARGDEQRPTPGQAGREAQKTSDDNKRTDLQRVGAGQVPLAPNQRFDDGESRTALALRTYWRQTMPNFQFSSRNEFIDSYLKWSLIFLAMVLGVTLYRNYRALDPPEVVSNEWFTKLKLLSRTRVASDTLLLQLELPADALPPINADSPTDLDVPVQSIAIADPDSMIQRPYTPLFADVFDPTSPHHTGKLDILVKHYRDGEVSGYLHSLAVGSKVMVRGPVRTWRFRERDYDDLIFVRSRPSLSNEAELDARTGRRWNGCAASLDEIGADRSQVSHRRFKSSRRSSRRPSCKTKRMSCSSHDRRTHG